MGAMASQIASVTIVYSAVCPGVDQRKHQSSGSLAFVWGIHRWPVNSPHKWPVTQNIFPFYEVIMVVVGFDDDLSSLRCQAIVWICEDVLLINHPKTKFEGNRKQYISFKKMRLEKKSSAKWWPFCFGPSVVSDITSEITFLDSHTGAFTPGLGLELIYVCKRGASGAYMPQWIQ